MILEKVLETYVDRFNAEDEEIYRQEIGNDQALHWLKKKYSSVRMPGSRYRGNILFQMVDVPETRKKDSRGIYNLRISAGCTMGRQL